MKQKIKLLPCLYLITALVRVSVQQCTIEKFEDSTALDTVQSTQATDANQTFTINKTTYNCLSTSQIIGVYRTMSVSILYTRSDNLTKLRQVRYNMVCFNNMWSRIGQQPTALLSNDTRHNCSDCTNQTVNDHHCTSCDSSCTGLNQCYGPMASQCCSYNDGGNCTADCGMNREGNSTFHCVCSDFWTGVNCSVCSLNCTNGGSPLSNCSACWCAPGYEGTLCDVDINECSPNPCQNGGTCSNEINSYSCSCIAGYTGNNCENNIDDCSNNPCQNGGTCIDMINDYNCTCNPVYSGHNCSDCAMLNCEQCKESSRSVMGECTKCAGVFVLDRGTCNDNCGIPNCILCNKVDMKCVQCQIGYREDNGKCSAILDETGDDKNGGELSTGSIIGIAMACVVTVLILILLIAAIRVAVSYDRKKTTDPDLRFNHMKEQNRSDEQLIPINTLSPAHTSRLSTVNSEYESVDEPVHTYTVVNQDYLTLLSSSGSNNLTTGSSNHPAIIENPAYSTCGGPLMSDNPAYVAMKIDPSTTCM